MISDICGSHVCCCYISFNVRSQVLTLKLYTAIEDFFSEETGNKFLKKGDKVEVLDTSRPEFWLVRRVSRGSEIGFVRHTCLKKDDDG